MRVGIRVDASAAMGLGHLMRCVALAHALRDAGAEVRFISRELGLDVAPQLEAAGFALLRLPAAAPSDAPAAETTHAVWLGVSQTHDACDTVVALSDWPPDWMVVDHYAIDARWHRCVADALGASIAAIDDLADRPLDVRLLIDHNLAERSHRHKYAGRVSPETPILGGPHFALLGPAYAKAPRYEFHAEVRSIGIFMGGADAGNLSALALRACREHANFRGPIEIASTRANPHWHALEALAAQDGRAQVLLDQPDLAAFFARHDLQLGAGGGATWERCCVGAPSLLLVAASNQNAVIPALQRCDAVAALPPDAPLDTEAVGASVAALCSNSQRRKQLGVSAGALVDGLGALRVALRMLSNGLRVRCAAVSDCDRLLAWRNHPITRAVSRNPEPITPQDHANWLGSVLTTPHRRLLIGHIGSIHVGTVRFDLNTKGDAEVSIHLAPEWLGLGLGKTLLREAEAQCHAMLPGTRRFTATVLAHNPASARLFEASGYQCAEQPERWFKCVYAECKP